MELELGNTYVCRNELMQIELQTNRLFYNMFGVMEIIFVPTALQLQRMKYFYRDCNTFRAIVLQLALMKSVTHKRKKKY